MHTFTAQHLFLPAHVYKIVHVFLFAGTHHLLHTAMLLRMVKRSNSTFLYDFDQIIIVN